MEWKLAWLYETGELYSKHEEGIQFNQQKKKNDFYKS